MHDTLLVRRGKRIGELNASVDEFFHAEAACGQLAAQCPSHHQLIDYEACVRNFDEIKYNRDPWMIETRCRPRFRCQPTLQTDVVCRFRQQHLQRNPSVELRVESAKHYAHTTAPDLFPGSVPTGNEFALHQSDVVRLLHDQITILRRHEGKSAATDSRRRDYSPFTFNPEEEAGNNSNRFIALD